MKKYLAAPLIALWAVLTLWAWTGPAGEISEAERRPLAQMPQLSLDTVLSGEFMENFEDYTLDQFPLRDAFRQLKALFHYNVLSQKDNNGIYLSEGFAVQQEYPLDESSLDHALARFSYVYEKYLTGCNVHMAVVPDKGYYLAEAAGQLAMDYEALFSRMVEGMPWAAHVDLTDCLTGEDYYRTDTHWRQEELLDAAGALCDALAIPEPKAEDYTLTTCQRPFYGVYYGQAALPMEPDELCWLESEMLLNCTVYDYESGTQGKIYDREKLKGKDLYEVFLSGSRSLLTIENPAVDNGRELIVFRDSFGSAMVPLFVQGYERITLVDIRYIQPDLLGRFLEFSDQDVLFLYSTLVLNNSETIK